MSRNNREKSHPPVSISSKTLSQGERRLRLTQQAYERLQDTASAMNNNVKHGRDLTFGINRRRIVVEKSMWYTHLVMPQNPEQGRRPEHQPPIYYLASRFKTREEAAVPYFAVQESIKRNIGIANLSAYRFKRQWEEQSDKPWYVLVLGITPPNVLHQRLTEALSVGEKTTVPDHALLELAKRRVDQQKHGSWVEAHYGESGLWIKFSTSPTGKEHRRK